MNAQLLQTGLPRWSLPRNIWHLPIKAFTALTHDIGYVSLRAQYPIAMVFRRVKVLHQ